LYVRGHALPLSGPGKVLKPELRQRYWADAGDTNEIMKEIIGRSLGV
jgi:hypothetical protein